MDFPRETLQKFLAKIKYIVTFLTVHIYLVPVAEQLEKKRPSCLFRVLGLKNHAFAALGETSKDYLVGLSPVNTQLLKSSFIELCQPVH